MLNRWFSHPLKCLERQRRWLDSQPQEALLRSILQTPLPTKMQEARQLDYLVVDFETSGFDAQQDHILSIGWVEIRQGVIDLSSARHRLIRSPVVNGETAKVHHLLPETLQTGDSIREGITHLLRAMPSKVLVAHGAILEKQFLAT